MASGSAIPGSRKAGFRGLGKLNQELVNLSTGSTVLSLTLDQQDAYCIWGGQSSAARIRLPAPEEGMFYQIFMNGPGVSTATKFLSSALTFDGRRPDFVVGGTTAAGVAFASTAENGASIEFVGLSNYRWLALRGSGTTVGIGTATS